MWFETALYREGVAVWIELELVAAVFLSVGVDQLIVKNFTRFKLETRAYFFP